MREQGGHVLALLAARFDDVDLADDCVQDALVQAVETWTAQGIPANPPGWLYTVAHNRAVDRLRRAAAAERRLRAAAPQLIPSPLDPDEEREELVVDEREVGDEQLRLMLLCCHPALDRDTQVALTLRLVGGLTTAEIASAYLVPEPTLAQRIVRAKRKIRAAGIPLRVPARLEERVGALLSVLLLIFNEGYLSRGGHADAVRVDLADAAIGLTERTLRLLPGHPEVEGLLALQLYHRARMSGRLDAAGDLVLLERQDRTAWDGALIARANTLLARALDRNVPGPCQVQAFIASLHANAPTAADTDWPAIAHAYTRLAELAPSPVVTLNRAVAIAMADGPRAGLAVLDGAGGLERYHLWHAARAELLARAGEPERAREGFERALRLTSNPAEQRHLRGRIRELSPRT
ncbi:RNA polymerase sigma factor [Jiangella anatolica]|uniref:RNA polymerase n=1 Tax=Jiangella anatolica TaxID=2670374 RepID=A0A2W2CM30_9ACTN|nr:sigma-70 family RNA polymerase sigma factor [Jiangella anatolica]PZF81253.1 RNA polymerase [Jiangella anatolica]